jgi:Raf kinase inhibitor-like YbhB/YbcL family protein
MSRLHVVAIALLAAYVASCSKKETTPASTAAPVEPASGVEVATLAVTSPAFSANGSMPSKYTCEGEDTSPPLAWSEPPAGTKSIAVIVDDPDAPDPAAPKRVWVHWVLYDIPPTTRQIPEGVKAANAIGGGARDGKSDFGRTGWGGPCPPKGRHRYFHKVYALDTVLPDLGEPTKADLEKAMSGHVLAKGELVGTYEKQAK